VETHLETADDGYRVLICDQGPGIPEDAREQALNRFTRLDQRMGSGAGLGLAIARRIAEMHGGRLALMDRRDGQPGLCVSVWFPAHR
jgi:two-component system sensor histidine kinase QseC